jgi:hypothetical protein
MIVQRVRGWYSPALEPLRVNENTFKVVGVFNKAGF